MHDDQDSQSGTKRTAPRALQCDRLIDVALLGGALLSLGLLIAIARTVVLYIACGLFFMAVAAYTVADSSLAARYLPVLIMIRVACFALAGSSSKVKWLREAPRGICGLCAQVWCSSSSATGRSRSCLGRQRSR